MLQNEITKQPLKQTPAPPILRQTKRTWPPNYVKVYQWRQKQLLQMKLYPHMLVGARRYYATRPIDFINHWVDTYDPRNAGSDMPVHMPMVMFKRQEELVEFLHQCTVNETPGLIEKARDMGATWVCCAYTVWLWLFWNGAAIGWGSRKEQLVDKIGVMDSIFEKLRYIIMRLPREFWPSYFRPELHLSYMRIQNPDQKNRAAIVGESGDNIGRGGRTLVYFKDESAHYPRPELIEASLSDNTRVPIDISSVNGIGNVFHRKREAGVEWNGEITPGATNVFVMDWRDHPHKTQEWYDTRKTRFESEGLLHIFSQEVDRDYASSVLGTIIKPEWVEAAIDADKKLPHFDFTGGKMAALDVADDSQAGDLNCYTSRNGVIMTECDLWGERDTGYSARRAATRLREDGIADFYYDSVGVGAGVKAEMNRLDDEDLLPEGLRVHPWNAGSAVLNPDEHVDPEDSESEINKDFYENIKAQGYWELRKRFLRTYRAVTEGAYYSPSELIVLPSTLRNLHTLKKELCQPISKPSGRLKLMIDKAPGTTKSPNTADSAMMLFWPTDLDTYTLDNI